MHRCEKFGSEIERAALFCLQCGSPLSKGAAAASKASASEAPTVDNACAWTETWPSKELDLFQRATGFMAQLRAGSSEIMGRDSETPLLDATALTMDQIT